ncbi:MAG: hypothetical protein GY853_12505 [PVC group bacterium]|nr:hypothetical protein [PVC group bacterium]
MKKIIYLIVMLLLFVNSAVAQGGMPDLFEEVEKDSAFSYDAKEAPNPCFFPVEKARWNGSKITGKNWESLDEFQRTMFIDEYVDGLEKLYQTPININMEDYLMYMNGILFMSDYDTSEILMTDALDDLLNRKSAIVGVQDGEN